MQKIIFTCCIAFISISLHAQEVFITKGKIEFERRVNIYKDVDTWFSDDDNGGGGNFKEQIKKTLPNFKISYFDLFFNDDKTLYKPGKETPNQNIPDWFNGPATDNIIFNNLAAKEITGQKTVFDNTYLIQDSSRKIDWRITNDTRTIAGFECRKAIGRIMDSVYVIAFYAEQIIPNGGPESFSGLPGMIMGVAIPRINTTWFATKLELIAVKPEDIVQPKKGKKTNRKDLEKILQGSLKDWGKAGQRNIWNIML